MGCCWLSFNGVAESPSEPSQDEEGGQGCGHRGSPGLRPEGWPVPHFIPPGRGVLRTASFPCLTPKSGSGLVGPFRTARLFLNSGASPASAPRTAPPPSFLGLTEDRSLSGPEGELPAGGNPDGRIGRGLGVGCDPHKGLAV